MSSARVDSRMNIGKKMLFLITNSEAGALHNEIVSLLVKAGAKE